MTDFSDSTNSTFGCDLQSLSFISLNKLLSLDVYNSYLVQPVFILNLFPSSTSGLTIKEKDPEVEIINHFINTLSANSKDLDSKFYDEIDSNFWELI